MANYSGYLLSCFLLLNLLECRVIGSASNNATTSTSSILKLRIGVPKKDGFNQFVKVKWNSRTKKYDITGFCIDVFNAAVKELPFKVYPEFEPFVDEAGKSAGTYKELVQHIPKKYDVVVGDVTIVADRAAVVDFTLPYTETGVRMLVRVQNGNHLNMWVFTRPFSWDLWLTTFIACLFIGLAIRIMERNVNMSELAMENSSPPRERLNTVSILWLPISQVVIPERELVAKNCSRFVLVVWLILAFVLMQSYTASLSSILTLDQLQPKYMSTNQLIAGGYKVGYQTGSFVGDQLLQKRLKFNALNLKPCSNISDYHHALRNGSVAAIFDEIPFIKVFLKKFGSGRYMMVGPTYKTDGLGFAFPQKSNLTSYFSRAILNVTQNVTMDQIEKKYFGSNNGVLEVQDQFAQNSDSPSTSLTAHSFAGLFMITGIATLLALIFSETVIWRKPVGMAKAYSERYLFAPNRKSTDTSSTSMDGSTTRRNNVDDDANIDGQFCENDESPSRSTPQHNQLGPDDQRNASPADVRFVVEV
ncbi:Glutamate receptor-like protein [Quillaja saponaria]|uniref:Glutamate receptor-like protein n=1 Tax=Quillaja saponaria TaxID=32244 RepID=A0AAD7PHG8_QUISA|nr:Glutamate receptor-like protein [Quillaja saponaria]